MRELFFILSLIAGSARSQTHGSETQDSMPPKQTMQMRNYNLMTEIERDGITKYIAQIHDPSLLKRISENKQIAEKQLPEAEHYLRDIEAVLKLTPKDTADICDKLRNLHFTDQQILEFVSEHHPSTPKTFGNVDSDACHKLNSVPIGNSEILRSVQDHFTKIKPGKTGSDPLSIVLKLRGYTNILTELKMWGGVYEPTAGMGGPLAFDRKKYHIQDDLPGSWDDLF